MKNDYLRAKLPKVSLDSEGKYLACCSLVPHFRSGIPTSVFYDSEYFFGKRSQDCTCTSTMTLTLGSTFANSSMAIIAEVKDIPFPPKSGSTSIAIRPAIRNGDGTQPRTVLKALPNYLGVHFWISVHFANFGSDNLLLIRYKNTILRNLCEFCDCFS